MVDQESYVKTSSCSPAGFTAEWNFTGAQSFAVYSIVVRSVLVCGDAEVGNLWCVCVCVL